MRLSVIALSIIALAAALLAAPAAGAAEPAPAPYRDASLPIAQRVDDLIARLTLPEKASQLVNQARAIPRLGIPAYNWWSEALHGVARNGYATVFPEPIGLAATFDPALIHRMAVAIGSEARVKYNILQRSQGEHYIFQGLDFWSPNINIFRDPRWGRGQETYGEDPFLTARMGVAFVTGLQGDDPRYWRAIATPKHFAVHSGPEPTRHTVDVAVSRHDEEDTYLPAFRAAIVEGHAASIMCAYNRVNGQPACASDFLLTDRLRGKWNYQGYVVSDCDAIADIQRGHHYTATYAEAAAVSLRHGVDNDCADFRVPTMDSSDYDRYVDAVKQGLVPESALDAALRRLFTARMKLGLFDPPALVPFANLPDSELNSEAHRVLALTAARESIVLLKNDGVLPLKPTIKRIAVIGPLADQVEVLNGNYNGQPLHPVTVLDGIRRQFPDAQIVFEPGTNFLRAAEPVPASALSSDDGRPGLKAAFFQGADFAGTPLLTRRDAVIAFDRDVVPVLPAEGVLSVRWTGFVSVPESGAYRIGLDGLSSKLWLDGRLVVDSSAPRQRGPKTVDLPFEKGRKYAVRIEQSPSRGPVIKFVWTPVIAEPLARAVAAARNADLVIAVAGISSALEGEEMTVTVPGFVGGDRTSLDMPKDEEDLLKAVKATGKKLVVVLLNGSALSVNWAARNADAILDAWYPGEEGGSAVAETLSGSNNPAGRLPVTFYTGVSQLPPFEDYSMTGRTYRYFTGRPLYPFGYGLSYTRFSYGGLRLSAARLKAGGTLGVEVVVRNEGAIEGDEVAELYLGFPKVSGAPLRALRGFARVHLAPGARQKIHFELSPRELSSVTEAGDRVVAAGAYRLSVGGGQPGNAPGAAAAFTIAGSVTLPD
ncbi:MAG TPA: glycoside hydrolase family 3 C-terminal domain-containing protein [Rhizomicrobium sp.]|nr:glycoside hydrolase family 3 C-terminal domain-containing protein [Rhizomicrobium sp.]